MMRLHKIIILCTIYNLQFIFINCLLAQTYPSDSLTSLLGKVKDDKTRANLLNDLSEQFQTKNIDSALKYAEQAEILAKNNHYKKGEADAISNMGIAYFRQGYYQKSLNNHLKSLKIRKTTGDNRDVAKSLNHIGYIYIRQGFFDRAFLYFSNALNILEKIDDKNGINLSLNGIGKVFYTQGNYDKALEYHLRALKIGKEQGSKLNVARSLENIGNVYFMKAYFMKIDYGKALEYYEKALKISETIGDEDGMSTALSNIGFVHYYRGNYNKTLECEFKSLKIKQKTDNKYGIAYSKLNLGAAYIQLKKYDSSFQHLNKALLLARAIEANNLIWEIYMQLSTAWEGKREYFKALEYYKLYKAALDSVYSEKGNKRIIELNAKYENEKKEKQILLLNKDKQLFKSNEAKKNMIIYIAIASAIFSIILIILIYNRRELKNKNSHQKMQMEKSELEQKALRAQMNPHFIFNSLTAISGYIAGNDSAAANKYLAKFGKLIRSVLENSNEKFISLEKEIETVRTYLELEQVGFNDKFDFIIEIAPEIDLDALAIPPMLLQPQVENAIIHGLLPKQEKGKLWIRFFKMNKQVLCEIEDNGIGRKKAADIKHIHANIHQKSMAVDIIQARLKIMQKVNQYSLMMHITDLEDESGKALGTKVTFEIPDYSVY